jgi:hypothetical protein
MDRMNDGEAADDTMVLIDQDLMSALKNTRNTDRPAMYPADKAGMQPTPTRTYPDWGVATGTPTAWTTVRAADLVGSEPTTKTVVLSAMTIVRQWRNTVPQQCMVIGDSGIDNRSVNLTNKSESIQHAAANMRRTGRRQWQPDCTDRLSVQVAQSVEAYVETTGNMNYNVCGDTIEASR